MEYVLTHAVSPVKLAYECYLADLKRLPKTDRLPTGETVESEIKRVTKHLKTLKK